LDIDTMARSSVQAVRLRQSLAKVASEVWAEFIEKLVYVLILFLPIQPSPIIDRGKIGHVKATEDA
jgi:predicted oxidoreductase